LGAELEVILRGRDFLSNNLKNARLNVDSLALSARKLHATFGVALGLTAAVAIGNSLRNMTKNSIEFADQIDTLSGKLNMTSDSVQRWDYVLRLNKSSVEQAQKGFYKISVSAYAAATGSKESQEAFKTLGIEIYDTNGRLKDSTQLTNEAVFALADMRDKTYAAGVAQKLFGKAAIELNPLIAMGSAEIKKQMAEAEKYGQILDTRTVKSMADAKDSAERMDRAFKVASANITVAFAPALIKVADLAARAASAIGIMRDQLAKPSNTEAPYKIKSREEEINKTILHLRTQIANKPSGEIMSGLDGGTLLTTSQALQRIVDLKKELNSLNPPAPPSGPKGKSSFEDFAQKSGFPSQMNIQYAVKQSEEEKAIQEAVQKWQEDLREKDAATARQHFEDMERGRTETAKLASDARTALIEDESQREYAAFYNRYEILRQQHTGNKDALANIDRAYAADKIALDRMVLQTQIQNARAGAAQMVGNLQTVAARWKEFAGIYKAIATAQAIWDTYSGAVASYKAMAGIPYVGPALGAVAAAAAIAAGVANIASIQAAKFGLGADYYTSGPQLIMVGENPGRREHVQITPESSPNINGPSGRSSASMVVNFYDQSGHLSDTLHEEIRQGKADRVLQEVERRMR
jgi:hypothetical protein